MSTKEIKREAINVHQTLSSLSTSGPPFNPTLKFNESIVKAFREGSRPVKLATRNKEIWTSSIVYFDSDYLYVKIPPRFEVAVGAVLTVYFPSEEGTYKVQTSLHKINAPLLCLKFQEPRKDFRYQPLSSTIVRYVEVDRSASWLKERQVHIIRLAEGLPQAGGKIVVKDAMGTPKPGGEKGKPVFTLQREWRDGLAGCARKGRLHDISMGGLSLDLDGEDRGRHSLIHMSLTMENRSHGAGVVELSLFGIVYHLFPLSETSFRYGVSFINRITLPSFYRFLQTMNAS